MAAVTSPTLRKYLSVGTGIGIVVRGADLEVTAVQARPNGPKILGGLHIENFRERPAAEWGQDYAGFLQKFEASRQAALVIIPRQSVIARLVTLPGVSDADAQAAIAFQLDSLHPFGDDETYSDFQRVAKTDHFVVAIVRRETIDSLTALFAEAGVKLAGITFSGSAFFSSLRLFGAQPAPALLSVLELESGGAPSVEFYAESEAKPFFSTEFEMPVEQAERLVRSETRLAPEVEMCDVMRLLPITNAAPDTWDLSDPGRSRSALGYAAALAAACPHLGQPVNLLPLELRAGSSRLVYVPTLFLTLVLLCLMAAWFYQPRWMDKKYLETLNAEIARVEPKARQLEALDRRIVQSADRIRLLSDFRKQTRADLDLLLETTKLLPPPAFVSNLTISRGEVNITGEIGQAEGMLKKLDGSPMLVGAEFVMPISRGQQGEAFRVKAKREGAAK
jgi:hypothetical protein